MDSLLKYWPVVAFGIVNIFGLGVMWWKVESARMAVNILFKKTDKLEADNARHDGEVRNLGESMERIDRSIGTVVVRVDQIFSLLTDLEKRK